MDKIADLRAQLAKLRAGKIPEGELYSLIHKFGHAGFLEAKADVEALLGHPDSELRSIALNVLTLHWGCSEHRRTCEEFILHDPDDDNRRLGVSGLGSLLKGKRDPKALQLLLQLFYNEKEEWHIRDTAYSSILYVLGRPVTEQPSAARKLDYNKDVNWDRIREAEEIVKSSESA